MFDLRTFFAEQTNKDKEMVFGKHDKKCAVAGVKLRYIGQQYNLQT